MKLSIVNLISKINSNISMYLKGFPMSQKNQIIIAIQDNTLLENSLVIGLYFSVVFFFVLLVAVFIMRNELNKVLTSGHYAPSSRAPKFLRYGMRLFMGLALLFAIGSGILFFKVQEIRTILQDQKNMLEKSLIDETQLIVEREAMAPITKEEFAQIDRDVRQELDNSMRLLEDEAKKRAANDPTTTVEIELHKLMDGLKKQVDQAQGREPSPVELDQNLSSTDNLDNVVNAIFMEPLKQVQEAEQNKKNDDRVVSDQ